MQGNIFSQRPFLQFRRPDHMLWGLQTKRLVICPQCAAIDLLLLSVGSLEWTGSRGRGQGFFIRRRPPVRLCCCTTGKKMVQQCVLSHHIHLIIGNIRWPGPLLIQPHPSMREKSHRKKATYELLHATRLRCEGTNSSLEQTSGSSMFCHSCCVLCR